MRRDGRAGARRGRRGIRLGGYLVQATETISVSEPPSLLAYDVRGLPVRDYWSGRFRAPHLLAGPPGVALRRTSRGFAVAVAATATARATN